MIRCHYDMNETLQKAVIAMHSLSKEINIFTSIFWPWFGRHTAPPHDTIPVPKSARLRVGSGHSGESTADWAYHFGKPTHSWNHAQASCLGFRLLNTISSASLSISPVNKHECSRPGKSGSLLYSAFCHSVSCAKVVTCCRQGNLSIPWFIYLSIENDDARHIFAQANSSSRCWH